MQKILTSFFSKYIVFALLGMILLFAWNNTGTEYTTLMSLMNNSTVATSSQYHQSTSVNTSENSDEEISVKPNSIWDVMAGEFKLNDQTQSIRVQAEIRKILADRDKFIQILWAAQPYIYYIHQQTEARHLPAEIGLIPVIESEFNPNDHSSKGARGLWQLMAGTAHELGVKVRTGYDGRLDFAVSTKAALAYFKDLGSEFKGNWYLAIAAYNCGQVRVESAVRKAGTRSYWKLSLPTETKLYVPKLLAVAEIIKNPHKYGIQLPPIANKPYLFALNQSTHYKV